MSKLEFDKIKGFVTKMFEIAIGPYTIDKNVKECVSMIHPLNSTNFLLVVFSQRLVAGVLLFFFYLI